jgi:hypothetical protein
MPKYQVYLPFQIDAIDPETAALEFIARCTRIGLYQCQLYVEREDGVGYIVSGDGVSSHELEGTQENISLANSLPTIDQVDPREVAVEELVNVVEDLNELQVVQTENGVDFVVDFLEPGGVFDAESVEAYRYALNLKTGDTTNE